MIISEIIKCRCVATSAEQLGLKPIRKPRDYQLTVGSYEDILSPLIPPHLTTHQNSLPVRLFSLSKIVMILRLFCGVTDCSLSLLSTEQLLPFFLLNTLTHSEMELSSYSLTYLPTLLRFTWCLVTFN